MKEFDDLNNPLLRRLFKSKIRNHKKIVRSKDDELRKLETKVEQLEEQISSLADRLNDSHKESQQELKSIYKKIIAKLHKQIKDQAVEHEKQISRLTTGNMALDESLAGLERTIVGLRKTIQE